MDSLKKVLLDAIVGERDRRGKPVVMKRRGTMVLRRHLLLVIAGCLLAIAFQVEASNEENPPFPDAYKDPESFLRMQLRFADLMVKGTVLAVNDSVSTEKGFDPGTRTPGSLYTFVTLQVDSVLKGDHDGPTLTFWYWGGRRWGYSQFTTDASWFAVGCTVVVLLDSRVLTIPLAEGLKSPPYQFKGRSLHYVVLEDSVYRAEELPRSFSAEKSDESPLKAVPVFSLASMLEVVGGYLRSTSIESLAVRADVIAIGEVLSRREAVDGNGKSYEIIEFGNGSILKGEDSLMPLEIKSKKVPKPQFGRALDRPEFPDSERILVFLNGPTNGVYRPLSYWRAARVLPGMAEEATVIRRISAVVGD